MPGLSDTSAAAVLNGLSGQPATAWPTSLWLALDTVVGIDAGTGFTEVTGGSYARVQIAGPLSISSTQGALGTTLTFTSVPAWVQPGMSVTNKTRADIPANTTVVSTTATTVVISNATTGTVATSGDVIQFSAFPAPVAGEPQTITNGSAITFPQATAGWGTAVGWRIMDNSSGGNLWAWDYLGSFAWKTCYITSANPAVFTVRGHGMAAGDNFIYSNEVTGSLPTFSAGGFSVSGDGAQGVSPLLTVSASTGADTLTALNSATTIATTSTGDGLIRKVVPQLIPINSVFSFGAGNFTLVGV